MNKARTGCSKKAIKSTPIYSEGDLDGNLRRCAQNSNIPFSAMDSNLEEICTTIHVGVQEMIAFVFGQTYREIRDQPPAHVRLQRRASSPGLAYTNQSVMNTASGEISWQHVDIRYRRFANVT